jgi:hypothetical protein
MRIHKLPGHLCQKTKCRTCKELVDDEDTHFCYMKKPEERKMEESEIKESEMGKQSGYDSTVLF